MKKILFAASFWDDDFIYTLSPSTKLFYIYLITNRNVTPSGFYKLGKIDKMKAGLTSGQVKTALEDLKNKVYIFGEFIFIKNLLHKSFLENTTEEKFKKSNIYKMIVEQITNNSTPLQLIELFKQTYPLFTPYKPLVSPLHTPSIPLPNTDTDTDTDTDKKKTKTKEKIFVLPDFIPLDTWEAYLEMRKKKPPTDKAKELLIAKLEKLKNLGHNPKQVLEQSILNNWTDVYPLKTQTNAHNKTHNKNVGKNDGQPLSQDKLMDNAWEYVSAMIELKPDWTPPKDATVEVLDCYTQHHIGKQAIERLKSSSSQHRDSHKNSFLGGK
jgi:hypothetical protein